MKVKLRNNKKYGGPYTFEARVRCGAVGNGSFD
jgi:hypothetical protein